MLNMPERIESEQVILVRPYPPTPELAKEVFEKIDLSRKTLSEWLGWIEATKTPEDVWLVNGSYENWDKGIGYAYLIRHKKTNAVLGAIDLMSYKEKHKSAEIGYWLSNDAVGHGYMTESLRALEKVAFEQGLNRLAILSECENTRSVGVAKRCGYHQEGILRAYRWNESRQKLCDVYVGSKLKAEWEKEHQKDNSLLRTIGTSQAR